MRHANVSQCTYPISPADVVVGPSVGPTPVKSTVSVGIASMSAGVSNIASGFVDVFTGLAEVGVGSLEALGNSLGSHRKKKSPCRPMVYSKAMIAPAQVPRQQAPCILQAPLQMAPLIKWPQEAPVQAPVRTDNAALSRPPIRCVPVPAETYTTVKNPDHQT